MNIISLLRFITSHPLNQKNKTNAIIRFFKWQINTRLNSFPIIYSFTDKAKLIIQKGMTGATQNLYCGLHEYNDMAFLLHVLRPEDLFIDIGANIGSYTILASAHVGAETFSFEPVPSTFQHLTNNIIINQLTKKVTLFNIGLGSQKKSIKFTNDLDTMNHVAKENEFNTINVPIEVLDDILQNTKTPLLLKIDVEGFETEVINGAFQTLEKSDLKAIIIELNGCGVRYNYDEKKIHDKLIELGFLPFIYNPNERELINIKSFGTHNTIYIRDVDYIKRRVQTAEKVRILDVEL